MNRLAALVVVLPFHAFAQAPAPPTVPPMASPPQYVPMNPAARASFEKQQAAYLGYQKCITEHPAEFQLYSATSQLIQVRNNRMGVDYELANSPAFRARWPGGYEQVAAAAFENYQKAGGTATTFEAVTEVPHPCPPPTLGKP